MDATGASTVTPRNLHFRTEAARDPVWIAGNPAATAVFNAMSLIFPDGERFFIDAVRAHRDGLPASLRREADAFCAQEAIHSREHVAFNAMLDSERYPLDAMAAEMRTRMNAMRKRGPRAMLLATIALEHFTAILADLFLVRAPHLIDGAPPELVRLWRWHAMEETEHKAVAFDVFREVTKHWPPLRRYAARVLTMAFVTVLFVYTVTRFSVALLRPNTAGIWRARAGVFRYLFVGPGPFRRCFASYAAWYRPGFHPWHIDNRAVLADWSAVEG
jgi:predicted metal-dependent hydrolase